MTAEVCSDCGRAKTGYVEWFDRRDAACASWLGSSDAVMNCQNLTIYLLRSELETLRGASARQFHTPRNPANLLAAEFITRPVLVDVVAAPALEQLRDLVQALGNWRDFAAFNQVVVQLSNTREQCAACVGNGVMMGFGNSELPCDVCKGYGDVPPRQQPSAPVALSEDERSELSKLRLLVAALEWLPECTLSFTEVDSFLEEVREMGWLPPVEHQQPSAPASSPWVAVASGVMPEDGATVFFIAKSQSSFVIEGTYELLTRDEPGVFNDSDGYWNADNISHWKARYVEPTPAPPSDSADLEEP